MEETFKHIITDHNGILYKIARSYASEQADFDDLYQEILVQLWQSFPRFEGKAKVSTWIYRVALNTALTFTKKKKRKLATSPVTAWIADTVEDRASQLAFEKAQQKRIDLLYQCINELAKEERALILLHLEGKSYEESAEIMGITSNYVGVKIMRIKKRLFTLLSEKGYGGI